MTEARGGAGDTPAVSPTWDPRSGDDDTGEPVAPPNVVPDDMALCNTLHPPSHADNGTVPAAIKLHCLCQPTTG